MSGPSIVTEQLASSRTQDGRLWGSTLSDYWALTKPEVNFLILITTGVGFYLGCRNEARPLSLLALFNTLLGTLLVASGTGTLNQYIEREFDAQMRRTARRPAASGRLKPQVVLVFGIALAAGGSFYLAATLNGLASMLSVLTLLTYLFLYTPLKRKTPWCVLVGSFPGAMPPLIGWAAASGRLNSEAWTLYVILFLWQFPHFMAIAWMYREDYDRAGYLVLPRGREKATFIGWQSVLPSLALLSVTVAPLVFRHASPAVTGGTLLLSLSFLYFAGRLTVIQSNAAARQLLLASVIYLPSVFVLQVLTRVRSRELLLGQKRPR